MNAKRNPRVLWINRIDWATTKLSKPRMIFSAASKDEIRHWYAENSWCRAELVHFGTEGVPFMFDDPKTLPWRVLAYTLSGDLLSPHAMSAVPEMRMLREGASRLEMMFSIAGAAEDLARAMPGPIWELYPECTHGLISAGCALANNACVSLSHGSPDAMATKVFFDHGVDADCRESDLHDTDYFRRKQAKTFKATKRYI